MVDIDSFRQIALSFPDVVELPDFEKTSFRTKGKIFATLTVDKHLACLKLSPLDQSVFCAYDKSIIYPVPNKWGIQGWTLVELKKIRKTMLKDAISVAYNEAARIKSR
ncbi:MAG: MmcQ/YjbR family DNA-binding protein [Chitinophagaceae bacterium]|nr:MmcQ/YjbR family DNA-binding protein [Chitinophagaceae bacterium]